MSGQESTTQQDKPEQGPSAARSPNRAPGHNWQIRADLVVSAVLVALAATGFLVAQGWITFWEWLLSTSALIIGVWIVKGWDSLGRSRLIGTTESQAGGGPATRDSQRLSPPAPVVHEFELDGLQLVTGSSEQTDRRILVSSTRLNRETIGFAVLNTSAHVTDADIREMMHIAFAHSATPHRAAARLLHKLEEAGELPLALVAMWYPLPRLLAYLSVGFEEGVIIRQAPNRPMDRPTWRARSSRTVAFRGLHRLERGERWIFYTPDLVQVPDPMNHPFSRVAIAQYGSDERGMAPGQWISYLLARAARARAGGIPHDSMMLALVCNPRETSGEKRTVIAPTRADFAETSMTAEEARPRNLKFAAPPLHAGPADRQGGES